MAGPPVAKLDESCIWSPTADAAAMQLFAKLPKGSRETAAAIYSQQGPDGLAQFCYSHPIAGKQDSFQFETEKGRHLAAIAHDHPGGHDEAPDGLFSPNDVAMAEVLRRPSYVRVNSSDNVIKYVPGQTPTDNYETSNKLRRGKVSKGDVVGNLSRRDEIAAAYDAAAGK